MRSLILLLLFLPAKVYCQNTIISIYNIKGYSERQEDSFNIEYPLIVTGFEVIDHKINNLVSKAIFDTEPGKMASDSTIREAMLHWLTDIDYEVHLNTNKILSITISVEGVGAYPSTTEYYFNFNTETGEQIKITDIIPKSKYEKFKIQVRKDKFKALTENKNDLNKMYNNKEIDKENLESAEETMEYCFRSLNLENFILTKDYIEIKDACEFPKVNRNLTPVYELKYLRSKWEH